MGMIHITEKEREDGTVIIKVDGVLDWESVPVLREVCGRCQAERRKIQLNLEGIVHVTREGRDFLYQQREQVVLVNPPRFLDISK